MLIVLLMPTVLLVSTVLFVLTVLLVFVDFSVCIMFLSCSLMTAFSALINLLLDEVQDITKQYLDHHLNKFCKNHIIKVG